MKTAREVKMCEEQKKIIISKEEYEEHQKLKENVKLLKWKIKQSNKELMDWVEKNFGLERE